MLSDLPTIGIRFDINKIDSSSYGDECWKTFWRAISPTEISGVLLFEGDTTATLNGHENVYCIAVQSINTSAIEKVRTTLSQNTGFKNVCAMPMFVESPKCASEPLVDAGRIDGRGILLGDAWNARSALEAVKKGQQSVSETNTVQPPQLIKSATSRNSFMIRCVHFAILVAFLMAVGGYFGVWSETSESRELVPGSGLGTVHIGASFTGANVGFYGRSTIILGILGSLFSVTLIVRPIAPSLLWGQFLTASLGVFILFVIIRLDDHVTAVRSIGYSLRIGDWSLGYPNGIGLAVSGFAIATVLSIWAMRKKK